MSPVWEHLIMYTAQMQNWVFNAILAISALTREHYYGTQWWCELGMSCSLEDYATYQYSQAIRHLNSQLNETTESAELALLGSILFVTIEFLQVPQSNHRGESNPEAMAVPNLVTTHLNGGLAILRDLKARPEARALPHVSYLEVALHIIENQLLQFQNPAGKINDYQSGMDWRS